MMPAEDKSKSKPKLKVADGDEQDTRKTVFWYYSNKRWNINRIRLRLSSAARGFRLYHNEVYKVIDKFIYKFDDRFYFDDMEQFIKDTHDGDAENILNAFDTFIQKTGKHAIARLPIIDEKEIVRDTKHSCYKFYEDAYIKITADKIQTIPYSQLPGLTFADKVQARIFRSGTKGRYIEFLNLACDLQSNYDYVSKIVGYYAHEYNDEGMGYFAVLTEQVSDPKMGGGSGKNLFTSLMLLTTSMCDQSGSQTKFDDTTFQVWAGERIFSVSDLPKDFDFVFFKNISTHGITHKKLYFNRQSIDISASPKLIFNTNFSYNCSDGGLKRRIIPLEFTDFFTINGGVEGYFNCWFPNDWNDEDWAGYDGFTTSSIQNWIKSGMKMKPNDLSAGGWRKQFELSYGDTISQIIETYWKDWLTEGFVSNQKFKQQIESFYSENPVKYRPGVRRLNKAIEDYASQHKIEYKSDQQKKSGFENIKGRLFIEDQILPF